MSDNYENVNNMENIPYVEEEVEVSFWEQFPLAFMPNRYGKLIHAKTGQMIGFVTLFMLVITIVLAGHFYLVGLPKINDALSNCPEFSLKNGILELESDYEIQEEDVYICASDSLDMIELSDVQKLQEQEGYTQIVIIGRNNLVFYNNGQYQTANFSDFKDYSIDRDFVVNKIVDLIYVFVGIGFVFYFIFGTLLYFFFALCYFILMIVVSKIFKREVENKYLYKACVFGKAFMVVITTLISLLPVSVSVPTFGKTMLTLAFLIFALRKIPLKETGVY